MRLSVILAVLSFASAVAASEPIRLHPQNPHYFQWRGQPVILLTSGEHYGAVLNRDFAYQRYLDTLAADGLNLTRTFSGVYCENPTAFNISSNTLAPAPGRLLCPWARSTTPGYANGGYKYDLTQWDANYFGVLKDFVEQAGRRGIVVEFTLFCPFYDESMWKLSPMNAANNVNNVGTTARTNVYTLDRSGNLLAEQERVVRKIVTELRGYDNVMYEICNEPYFGGVTLEWQHHIADVIAATEKNFKYRHLITQNIANGKKKIENPHAEVSVFNFHYANPPDTVKLNYALNKVIGDNETGFKGTNDSHYRMEAWEFLLAGGALYNNLDYSFTVGHADGTYIYPAKQPGGGNPVFRRQMKVLANFLHSFEFLKMTPDSSCVVDGAPYNGRMQALVEPGSQYAFYLKAAPKETELTGSLTLDLPRGNYRVECLSVLTGKVLHVEKIQHPGGRVKLPIAFGESEIAMRIKR